MKNTPHWKLIQKYIVTIPLVYDRLYIFRAPPKERRLVTKTPLRLVRIEGTDFAQHGGHQHSHRHSDVKKRMP